MNITVDGVPREVPVEPNVTLGQVYRELVDSLINTGKVVATIEVNGKAIRGGQIWDLSEQPISEVQTLDLATREAEAMVKEMLVSTDQHLELLITETEKSATMFRVGDELGAQDRFGKCVSGLQWFLKSLDVLRSFLELDYSRLEIDGASVEENLQRFLPLMDEILGAQSEGDVILIADLMEYELVAQLKKWRQSLPELQERVISMHRQFIQSA
jgi:hypothetical protein